jgi:DNA-binding transcriptional MerR regulator
MDYNNNLTTNIKVEEIAKDLGISRTLIKFWEEEFDLPKRENGSMTPLETAEIKLIHELIQDNSLTLEDAKEAFSIKRIPLEKKFETIATLERIKQGLISLQQAMENE